MKLNELLGKVEILTDIELYESPTKLWDAKKEKLIEKDITVSKYYSRRKDLYSEYGNCEVVGIFINSDKKMQITIYKKEAVVCEKKS